MATNAQWIFEKAMSLLDKVNDLTGQPDSGISAPYRARTLGILNVLACELYYASGSFGGKGDGTRPLMTPVTDFEQELELDDAVSRGVLPYGLAGLLIMEENTNSAAYLLQKYREVAAQLARQLPRTFAPVEDVYGGIGTGL